MQYPGTLEKMKSFSLISKQSTFRKNFSTHEPVSFLTNLLYFVQICSYLNNKKRLPTVKTFLFNLFFAVGKKITFLCNESVLFLHEVGVLKKNRVSADKSWFLQQGGTICLLFFNLNKNSHMKLLQQNLTSLVRSKVRPQQTPQFNEIDPYGCTETIYLKSCHPADKS